MKGKSELYDIKPVAGEQHTDAVYRPNVRNENTENQENSTLINEPEMPQVVVTGVSDPSPNEVNSRERAKLSACYEFQRGAEVAARTVGRGCCDYWSSTFSMQNLKQKLPIITWLPKYRLKSLKCDFIAGLTVGLTVIPQGMAYAALAGLDLQVC